MKIKLIAALCSISAGWVQAADFDCASPDSATLPTPHASRATTIKQLNIITHPIFDENAPDTIALHRFANWLHIVTQPEVIAERLPFSEGDRVDDTDLAEAERIIRAQPYIRDAKVRFVTACDEPQAAIVEVESWDNWSLIPTISFGRKGGKNKLSLGVKEDNFLGHGIRTRLKYNNDEQRSGYQFTVKSATPALMPYSTLLLDYLDNDDGELLNIEFDRPFYHARTDSMYFASYLSDDKVVDIYQNGLTRTTFANQSHRYELATGWQFDSDVLRSQRIKLGVVEEESLFLPNPLSPDNTDLLPQDRNYQYLWLGFESLQRDFRVMSDIYLIEQTEDINLGWHYQARLGLDFASQPNRSGLGYHLDLDLRKGWQLDDSLVLFAAKASGAFNQSHDDHVLFAAQGEYFKRYNQQLTLYARLSAASAHNPFLDTPLTVGDDTGVRGYPLQYQHGTHSMSGSLEARIYTGYNLYRMINLGLAAFVDAGRAWGGPPAQLNENDQLLSSIGIGARLYSNRASHQNVIHIDIVKPLNSADNVDSWEWRLQVKESF